MLKLPTNGDDLFVLDYLDDPEKQVLLSILDPDTLESRTCGIDDPVVIEVIIMKLQEYRDRMINH